MILRIQEFLFMMMFDEMQKLKIKIFRNLKSNAELMICFVSDVKIKGSSSVKFQLELFLTYILNKAIACSFSCVS